MPFIADVERTGEKEVEGAFKISAKGVNLFPIYLSTVAKNILKELKTP